MSISEKQNSEWNLKRLAAQRQLYTEAKTLMGIQFILSGVFILALAILSNIIDEKYRAYTAFAAIAISILDELLLSKRIDNIKENAARIQEEFDCDVLEIPQNKIKIGNHSMMEIIQEKSKKYTSKNNDYSVFTNWYPGIDEEDNRFYRLVCQATNCWWNQNLRKWYSLILLTSLSCVFAMLLFLAIIKGITVSVFLMSVLSPILPAFILVYKTKKDNSKAIENLNHMKSKLDEIISKAENSEPYPDEQLINDSRCLQDMIFDNRASSPLIPDKLYFRKRNKYEEIAQDTNRELIRKIKQL
ncbi:MAG: S-4TM family putative pore-forming effector [Clostridiaceae bacterium]